MPCQKNVTVLNKAGNALRGLHRKKQVLFERRRPLFMDQKKLRLVLSKAHVQDIGMVFCIDQGKTLTLCGIVKGCVCTRKEFERRYVNIRITEGLGWNRYSESVE